MNPERLAKQIKNNPFTEVSERMLYEFFPQPQTDPFKNLILMVMGHRTEEDAPTHRELLEKFCAENNVYYWNQIKDGVVRHYFKAKQYQK